MRIEGCIPKRRLYCLRSFSIFFPYLVDAVSIAKSMELEEIYQMNCFSRLRQFIELWK